MEGDPLAQPEYAAMVAAHPKLELRNRRESSQRGQVQANWVKRMQNYRSCWPAADKTDGRPLSRIVADQFGTAIRSAWTTARLE